MAVLLFGRVPPCGAAYFARGGKVGKTPPGTAPMSAYAERALKVAFPRTPVYGGHLPVFMAITFRRQNHDCLPFLPRGHRPLPGLKFDGSCAVQTPPGAAEPGQFTGEGQSLSYTSPAYGREAKRSFAGSSLPSFLSRKREAFLLPFFSKKGSKRGVGWQAGSSLVCCVGRTNFITWRKPIWTMKKSAASSEACAPSRA